MDFGSRILPFEEVMIRLFDCEQPGRYPSPTLNKTRRMMVYTPPGHGASEDR
jgi:hypothetical protein